MTKLTMDDGVALDYVESGSPTGRPIVFIAGFRAPATTWLFQQKYFAKRGYRVIALDTRGQGLSDHPASGITMVRRGDDIASVLDQLDLHDVALVGGSMGGNTVWAFLSRHTADRVSAAVIIDQTPKMMNTADWPHGFYGYDESNRDTFFAAGVPPTGHGKPFWQRGIRFWRLMRLLVSTKQEPKEMSPAELVVLNDHAKADWRDTIAKTPIPVLMVTGAESELWPPSHGAAAAALSPKVSTVTIEHAGHTTNWEQPHTFNEAMTAFLSSHAS